MAEEINAFLKAIRPITESIFFEEYWEEKPLVIARNEPAYFYDLISVSDIDRILSSTGLRVPGFRLIREGSQIPTSQYTKNIPMTPSTFDGLVDLNKVSDEYAHGSTIVLQALERSWLPLVTFCKELETYFGHPVQANLYLTPTSAQGFAAHFDTHDTLILQIEGRKRWKTYGSPFPLPLSKHKYSKTQPHDQPNLEFVLEAGDTLYMPRGVVHEALTTDSYSLHITIGIKVLTWFDVVSRVVKRALEASEQDLEFRRALPLRFAEEGSIPPNEVSQKVKLLLNRFEERLKPSDALEMISEQFISTRWPFRENQIRDLNQLSTLTKDSSIARQKNIIFRLQVDEHTKTVRLDFHGKVVVFPSAASDSLKYISQTQAFRLSEIPGNLDKAGKLVLVRRLIREGFLTFNENANG